jgi:imidazolonepropionase-like amidohydrolase
MMTRAMTNRPGWIHRRRHAPLWLVPASLIVAWWGSASPPAVRAQQPAPQTATLLTAARVITGDGAPPIEDGALLIENGRIVRVGRRGDIVVPLNALRVDLAGKTIIPALVDGHSHIGYMKDLTSGAENYTRDNILDHLRRFAYFGVAASQAMGSDFGELPFELRDETAAGRYPDAARFLTAGRGLAPLEEISADNMRQAAFPVTTVAGARASVQELARRKVTIVKTWVDDRGGTVRKLPPELYTAIIDEAHALNLRVAVHATGLQDAKALLRAGIDIFAHMISDVDDELVALFKAHPRTVVLSALGGPHRAVYAPWLNPAHPLIVDTIRPMQIARLQSRFPLADPAARARAERDWDRLVRGVRRLQAAGVTIGAGTDGGGQQGDQFIGWTMHTELENLVMAGLSPSEALAAATRNAAKILRLDDLGELKAGMSADFIVLDANPLEDITNSRRISRVYLRGRQIDRPRLRAAFMTN